MIVEFRSSFLKDIKKIRLGSTKTLIENVIEVCEKANSISEIKHCESLKSKGKFYKIKYGHYRFGVYIDGGIVEFLKFGERQNFYSDFPPY
jgi:mRNA interferase RelE/StbE